MEHTELNGQSIEPVPEARPEIGGESPAAVVQAYTADSAETTDENNGEDSGSRSAIDKKVKEYAEKLIVSKNMILRGAPGTGKSFQAKRIAAYIISNGATDDYGSIPDKQKAFVQFHPSYDYTDFVEGLRPVLKADGTMAFELKDGIFKEFADRAAVDQEAYDQYMASLPDRDFAREAMEEFFGNVKLGTDVFQIKQGRKFTIEKVDEQNVEILIPSNATSNRLSLSLAKIKEMLESGKEFKAADIQELSGRTYPVQEDSYYVSIFQKIKEKMDAKIKEAAPAGIEAVELKKYVFIIDEINRGEISKIFGELFYSIDPGYRGKAGEISTQYAGMRKEDCNRKFYIPDNVYIIGTMNDIDRSVDTFDFAMRRRFRFAEVTAKESQGMLDQLGDRRREAVLRMDELNKEIIEIGLNENYQIGASYFLKLKDREIGFGNLWEDYLKPLLQDYVQGLDDEPGKLVDLENAYNLKKANNTVRANNGENA